ncbi:hypothetical protein SAMN05661093_08066 [Kibdelosporangium aridum]|uniref:Uncharacterized protein n=2 Tax=Kibdelosporangium aridum TaxID=2030 RepID=A0A1W2FPK5_KIBAR|nr:hypothetical protein SAMN05661093_08066 [Kibdelosporangium aridum]
MPFVSLCLARRWRGHEKFLFTMRMSFSDKAIRRVMSSQGQETFFAGHVAACIELGWAGRCDPLRQLLHRANFGAENLVVFHGSTEVARHPG